VFKKQTILLVITALFVAGAIEGTAIAAQNAITPKAQDQNNVATPKVQDQKVVALGETDTKQLLLLMNQDKDGKVSKQEFMRFMETRAFEGNEKTNKNVPL
jgi:hypothetical protein